MTWHRVAWVADTLGVSAPAVRRMSACGVLGPQRPTGSFMTWYEDIITEIASRPTIDETTIPPSLVVRMSEPTPAESGWRAYSGWTPAGPRSQQRNAVRGDWKIHLEHPEQWALVAVVGPVVVGAWQILGRDPDGPSSGRFRYLIDEDAALTAMFTGHRWNLEAGWTAGRRGNAPTATPLQ